MQHGNCYKAAATLLIDNRDLSFLLCHGDAIGTGPIKGIKFGHAWVETPDGNLVFDFANGKQAIVPAAIYYKVGQITNVHRYTIKQAAKLIVEHAHYGPWHESDAEHYDAPEVSERKPLTRSKRLAKTSPVLDTRP